MSGKLIRKVGRKITAVVLVGISLLGSGCATYKTMSPDLIQSAPPIRKGESLVENPTDYSKLTWQEAIEHVRTPEQAQDYLDRHFEYDKDEEEGFSLRLFNVGSKGESFKYNHTRAKGVCLDYATSAAALLSDDGYEPLLLCMRGDVLHAVFLYRTDEGFGALGKPPSFGVCPTLDGLVKSFTLPNGGKFREYAVVDLDKNFTREEWISGDVDLQIPFMDKWRKVR
ncbi:MAG: hypothetical protein KJ600_06420 [Nanoarchaeota archaeon]|nr:hypothetical protein [Nanoarchaeota archaeon]MBU1104159.1 hypothetical protein [Nanoarchaeota archaeon]